MSSIGLNLESSEDSDNDSKDRISDWGIIFMMLKNRGFTHKEILNLSYPQFNAYMKQINNPLTYGIVIPYMGGGEEDKEGCKVSSQEELLSLVADMNKDFM